jgi:hypothetical protein
MTERRDIAKLGLAFQAFGALLGLPSLAGLAFSIWQLVTLRDPSREAGASRESAADAVGIVLHAAASALKFAGEVAGFFFALFALMCIAVLILSVFLLFIGRALQKGRDWARYPATLILSLVSFWAGLLFAGSVPDPSSILPLVFGALGLYGLSILWRRPVAG